MLDILQPRTLLRLEVPIFALRPTPRLNGHVSKWKDRYRAPALCELDGQEPFADLYWAWNEEGFVLAVDVPQRTRKFLCDPAKWWQGDGLRICIATREPHDIRRGTRFCHFFYVLPAGGGRDRKSPLVGVHKMSRAKESPAVDPTRIQVALDVRRKGYGLEIMIPAACLNGWSPQDHPRIGIFTKVRDAEFGGQNLSAPDDHGWNVDPSTWATGVLTE